MTSRILWVVWLFFLVIGLWGCGADLPRIDVVRGVSERPCRIAILPFINQTEHPTVARLVYRVLLAQLVGTRSFEVVEEGAVRHFLVIERAPVGQEPPARVVRLLGNKIGAQAVISGEILEAKEEGGNVSLAFNLWVRETKTGRLLWSTYHSRRGEDYRKALHFGRICTITGLAQKMISEIVAEWQKKGLGGCHK
ncbi:hypothetical protein [Thermosulfuriphilus sp.]